MKILRHILIVAAAVLLLVGFPVIASGYPARFFSGVDAVASATVMIDQPSGGYVVLINRNRHPDEDNLAVWEDYFSGKEIGFLFEDIHCMVGDSDPAGLELARSFQSRLPENQMALRTEDLTLMLSKAHSGGFDVILMSEEAFDAWNAGILIDYENTLVIEAGSPDHRSGAESEGL